MKIWKPVMQKYFQQIPRTGFSQPPRKIQVGKQVRVPSLNGLSIAAATRKLERRGFTVEKRVHLQRQSAEVRIHGLVTGSGFDDFGVRHGLRGVLERA